MCGIDDWNDEPFFAQTPEPPVTADHTPERLSARDLRLLSGLLTLAFPSPLYYAAKPVVDRIAALNPDPSEVDPDHPNHIPQGKSEQDA